MKTHTHAQIHAQMHAYARTIHPTRHPLRPLRFLNMTNCTPPYSGENAIACRCDLNPAVRYACPCLLWGLVALSSS
jgi:hypothetical protein